MDGSGRTRPAEPVSIGCPEAHSAASGSHLDTLEDAAAIYDAATSPPHLHWEIYPGGPGTPATNPTPTAANLCR
jgi:hypothetical protein